MTQNYSYIDVALDGDDVLCWVRDEDGELSLIEEPQADYSYLFVPCNKGDGEYKNMFGERMRKIKFDSKWEMSQFARNSSENLLHESDVPIIYKFILDNFSETMVDAPYNIGYYDIEVDFDLSSGTGYPSIHDPFGEINGLSLFDTKMNKYIEWMLFGGTIDLNDDKYDGYEVDCRYFDDEHGLLRDFCKHIEHIDILTGWNSAEFDISYIMERLIKNFGKAKALRMLCRDGMHARKKEYTNDYGEDVWTWILAGRQHLDMMALFKKFIPKEGSNSLSAVCQEVLNMDKIDYDGDLGELYRENPQLFFEYSLHDSRLLLMLDRKLDLIKIAMSMSRWSCVLPSDVTGTVKPVEMALIKFLREKGNIVAPDKKDNPKKKFRGAVVYDTIAGLHKKMFTIDLTALYPSCMRILGLSTETLVMQLLGEDIDYYKVLERSSDEVEVYIEQTDETITCAAYEVDDIIRQNGYTISGSGTIYNGELGLLSEFAEMVFLTRKKYKTAMFAEEDPVLRMRYDLLQKVYKVFANSIYGSVSNQHFRLFDIRMAKSITYTGAVISKFMAYKTNQTMRELVDELR